LLYVLRVLHPILALIIGMAFPPFSLAVSAGLPILRIGFQFAAVILAFASLLTQFTTAHPLLRLITRRQEAILTKGTDSAARLHAPIYRFYIENTSLESPVESLPPPCERGCSGWSTPKPAKVGHFFAGANILVAG
jgi:hypothetical protein